MIFSKDAVSHKSWCPPVAPLHVGQHAVHQGAGQQQPRLQLAHPGLRLRDLAREHRPRGHQRLRHLLEVTRQDQRRVGHDVVQLVAGKLAIRLGWVVGYFIGSSVSKGCLTKRFTVSKISVFPEAGFSMKVTSLMCG